MTERQKKNFRIYEAISHEAAMEASETCANLAADERDEAYRFVDAFKARIAAERRTDRAAQMKQRVRPSILAMVREAVEKTLRELFAAHPTALLAHRDLTELSDDDLRTALEDALTLIERMS